VLTHVCAVQYLHDNLDVTRDAHLTRLLLIEGEPRITTGATTVLIPSRVLNFQSIEINSRRESKKFLLLWNSWTARARENNDILHLYSTFSATICLAAYLRQEFLESFYSSVVALINMISVILITRLESAHMSDFTGLFRLLRSAAVSDTVTYTYT